MTLTPARRPGLAAHVAAAEGLRGQPREAASTRSGRSRRECPVDARRACMHTGDSQGGSPHSFARVARSVTWRGLGVGAPGPHSFLVTFVLLRAPSSRSPTERARHAGRASRRSRRTRGSPGRRTGRSRSQPDLAGTAAVRAPPITGAGRTDAAGVSDHRGRRVGVAGAVAGRADPGAFAQLTVSHHAAAVPVEPATRSQYVP